MTDASIKVTKDLLYLLVVLDTVSFEASMKVLRKPGFGGPTTMLAFLLKNVPHVNKTVV